MPSPRDDFEDYETDELDEDALDDEDEDLDEDDDEDDEDDLDEERDDASAEENAHFLRTVEAKMDPTMKPMQHVLTNESISVFGDGGKTYNIQRGAPNFVLVRDAIQAGDWRKVRESLEIRSSINTWAQGRFTFTPAGDGLLFDGKDVPAALSRRVLDMAGKGESPLPLFRFYERLSKNPSYRSVQQLYDFLKHGNIPILPDGRFLAYKGVNNDYTDVHSGKFVNKPGAVQRMPRNEISDDPNTPCHVGFHVGAIGYARGFGSRVVVCRVDPEDVVCVPYDYSSMKMRVCGYEVVGQYGENLPSDIYAEPLPETAAVVQEKGSVVAEKGKFKPMHTPDELMGMKIEDLRYIAVNDLKIVGAGHIQGGKAVLVARMMEVLTGHDED